jgi:ketosteroid isomerase-like protein
MAVVTHASTGVVRRLIDALNRSDLEAMIDCFHPDVRTEFPTQPGRGVRGREYIRAYWEQALTGTGDVRAKLFRCAADGDTVLSEWCWHGTRVDGTTFTRAGMTVHGIVDGRIAWQRLYLEPIRGDADTVGAWLLAEMGGSGEA